jgi:uncharacterized protein (TIGR04255 family)
MPTANLEIKKAERFPHLSRAPITEAVLEIKTRAEAQWEESKIRKAFERRLSDYPHVFERRQVQQQVQIQPNKAEHVFTDLGWTGLEFRTSNEKQLARFDRNAFSFVRLRPYQRWEKFECEALRLWGIHLSIAQPVEAHRTGLRFINQIRLPGGRINIDDYLLGGPHQLEELPLASNGFFHHDVISVPGSEFRGNIIRTIQPPDTQETGPTLILDIDIFTIEPAEASEEVLKRRLIYMRYLKNKIFFGTITARTKELLI